MGDETLVSTLPNIGDRFVPESDRRLGDLGSNRAEDNLGQATNFSDGSVIDESEVVRGGVVGAEDVRNDLECLEDIVVDQESVDKHEDRLRYLEGIFERSGSLGLEVLNGIVRYVTDRPASECRDLWNLDVSVVVEFLLENSHRIAGDPMSRTGLDDLEGIWAGRGK